MPIVLVGSRIIKLEVERLGKAAIRIRRPREAVIGVRKSGKTATVRTKRLASLSLPVFLLLLAFLLLSISWFLDKLFLTFIKCFWCIFSFFSLLFCFQRSSALFSLSLISTITFSIFLLSPQSKS